MVTTLSPLLLQALGFSNGFGLPVKNRFSSRPGCSKQTCGDKRCTSYVASCATGLPPEEFERFCAEDLPKPLQKKESPYEEEHLFPFLSRFGIFFEAKQKGNTVTSEPAYCVVPCPLQFGEHVIWYDGQKVFDSCPLVIDREIEQYDVLETFRVAAQGNRAVA